MKNHSHKLVQGNNIANKIPKGRSENAGTMIKVIEYNPAKHLLKVVRSSDNKPLDLDVETFEEVIQAKRYNKPAGKSLKTLASPSAPIIEVTDSFASIRGNGEFGFFTFREGGGNIIKGPLSIGSTPNQVRLAGITTLNPLLTTCFPSTIVTPIPTTLWALPGASAIQPLIKDVTIMATLVSAMG
jgi:hypothetical protein